MEDLEEFRQHTVNGFSTNAKLVRFTIERSRTALPSNMVIWQFSLNCKDYREQYERQFENSIMEELDSIDREILLGELDELHDRIIRSNSFDKEGEYQTFKEVYWNITGKEYTTGEWAEGEN